ncbi:MAG: hypothetical protein NVS9B13_05820 [Candidatus Acidiferrum sp.]
MKQKKQIAVLVGLMAALMLVWYLNFSKPPASIGTQAFSEEYKPMGIPDPTPHPVDDTRKTEYTKTVRNIFAVYVPPPRITAQAHVYRKTTVEQPAPLPPPTLPANLKFFGYGTVPIDGARRAFFTDGEEVFIVGEGETLLGRYRVLKVGNANLEFEEIDSGRRGTAPLEEQAPAA